MLQRRKACTNWAESYFSRIRRAEIGIHHKIAGPYADEMAWRKDTRGTALSVSLTGECRRALPGYPPAERVVATAEIHIG
ncbi:MAG: transposase [Alphaproteobacteria bacterium]|nr:transposase [Alphaproteobacteria bacterium]MBV9061714.1 transposase [Alphaproteobacteria bacterium]